MSSSSLADVAGLNERVDAELRSIVTARDMPLYRIMAYHLGWSDQQGDPGAPVAGQWTRGILCMLACRAVGGELEVAAPAAAAVELVEGFCQIHDDVQGGMPQRNDRDAVWWVWGPAQAINAGDGMHALARLALLRLTERGVPPATAFRAQQLQDEASLEACEGRFLDLEAQERIDVSVDAYMKMASQKTGALVSCAMHLGGLVASDDPRVLEALAKCGAGIGVTLQLRDDLRQLWGDDGAPPSPEAMNKTKLMPVVYALEKASLAEKRRLGDIYFKRVLEPDDVAKVRDVIEEMGARQYCEDLVTRHRAEALSALDVSGVREEGRADITAFVDSLLE